MFTPEVTPQGDTAEERQAQRERRVREVALSHAVQLAVASATGVTAAYLLSYADHLTKYLSDGTLPDPRSPQDIAS